MLNELFICRLWTHLFMNFFLDVHYIHFDLYEYTYKIHIFNTLELVYEF